MFLEEYIDMNLAVIFIEHSKFLVLNRILFFLRTGTDLQFLTSKKFEYLRMMIQM